MKKQVRFDSPENASGILPQAEEPHAIIEVHAHGNEEIVVAVSDN
jgi:hypothetical protein